MPSFVPVHGLLFSALLVNAEEQEEEDDEEMTVAIPRY